MTATYADNLKGDGVEAIIIAGGCNDPNGNTAVVDDTNATNYYCGQITDKTFIFYPSTENILEVSYVVVIIVIIVVSEQFLCSHHIFM